MPGGSTREPPSTREPCRSLRLAPLNPLAMLSSLLLLGESTDVLRFDRDGTTPGGRARWPVTVMLLDALGSDLT